MLNKVIRFFLENKLVVFLLLLLLIGWGIMTAPFNWKNNYIPTDPVPVDAIPDLGENQQIVFTEWKGRSPQDIEDQITYPLTTALLGVPGVKDIRSTSAFGFSSIYVIFEENTDFYWSRSRILEKINALPEGLLPEGVQPQLGPDATALGQIFWYTLEGRDKNGNPTGGWSLQELRSVQDFYVKYGLSSAQGVAEVASVGGFVKEYQVDIDPHAMKGHDVNLKQIVQAVSNCNLDVGAKTLEINKAEYFVRGLGYVKNLEDIENAVVATRNHVPVTVGDVARVHAGPSTRRGVLDKGGAEVTGGVVVSRYGANPMEVINNVKAKIREIEPGLPSKKLKDGTVSQLKIIPFYDRSGLIKETLGTLEEALSLEILITILVIIVMVANIRASLLISALLPVAVLICFIAMKYFGVSANVVALSGIAIAIGTMVDLGIILSENILRHLRMAGTGESRLEVVYRGASEVSSAVLTAVVTTVVSFIPVFALQAEEGRLFHPLAYTKTFALVAALLVALIFIPALAHILLGYSPLKPAAKKKQWYAYVFYALLTALGILLTFLQWVDPQNHAYASWQLFILIAFGINYFITEYLKYYRSATYIPESVSSFWQRYGNLCIAAVGVALLLGSYWMPLGVNRSLFSNFIFVALVTGIVLGVFALVIVYYRRILYVLLDFKGLFLIFPAILLLLAFNIWLGFSTVFGFAARSFDEFGVNIRKTSVWSGLTHTFPGLGQEFMPSLDEGSFLLMPTTAPHAGMEVNKAYLQRLDRAVARIPEVKEVVGKLGRVKSALDPAPTSMFENVINYKNEYMTDADGHRIRFKTNDAGKFVQKEGEPVPAGTDIAAEKLVQDPDGKYFRQWREHIRSPNDIWQEIVDAADFPGITSAPKLQPIETRQVMLQTGMRAPMGIKVRGPDLRTIENFSMKLEQLLKTVPDIKNSTVFAERIVGKPYLNIDLKRKAMARYGLSVKDVQHYIETAIGGIKLSTSIEGRERYPIRVRYPRSLRDEPEDLKKVLIPASDGVQIPLGKVVKIKFERGPQAIKSENTFLTGYITFGKKAGVAGTDAVESTQKVIGQAIEEGKLQVPAGVNYHFAGDYQSQQRARKRFAVIFPVVLLVIFLILYFQFRAVPVVLMVFSGIAVAFSGGFLLLWLYGQSWFMDFSVLGMSLQQLFRIDTINLSVAVWVGFIALFGIATDDGVVIATYLKQQFKDTPAQSRDGIRQAVIEAGARRVRPCLMTTATTLLALLPVLSSTGKGAGIMMPMAVPIFGGMMIEIMTLFVIPLLYEWYMMKQYNKQKTMGQE